MSDSKTTTVDIGGLSVQFPFEPYNIQKDFMSKVVSCCQKSPTGTGKTLSLLCSSLAWLTDVNRKVEAANRKANAKVRRRSPGQESASQSEENEAVAEIQKYKVIYTSRTHKQLSQAMDEMKRTVYQNNLTAVCLGSRDQYCVNEDVRSLPTLTEKNQSCREKRRCSSSSGISCSYYRRHDRDRRADYSDVIALNHQMQQITVDDEYVTEKGAVIDIEMMIKAGLYKNGCPYYAAQFASSRSNEEVAADVIFCPYNYIFKSSGVFTLKNSIVIFDEGHNIEKTCEEAGSASISTFTLKQCSSGLKILIEKESPDLQAMRNKYEHLSPRNLTSVSDFAVNLTAAITANADAAVKHAYRQKNETGKVSKPPITWFTNLLLTKLAVKQVNEETLEEARHLLGNQAEVFKELFNFFSDTGFKLYVDGKNDGSKNFLTAMTELADFLEIVFITNEWCELHKLLIGSYRVAITELIPNPNQWPKKYGWQLDLFCLNPAVAVRNIVKSGVRSIIITSGTLAPLTSFEAELGIDFVHKLSNPHVIQKDQLMIFPVAKFGDCLLDGSFRASNNNDSYLWNLGQAIATYVKTVPDGVLIFFKSYSALNAAVNHWRRESILTKIQSCKKIFEEPRNMKTFANVLDAYKIHVKSGKGAILMAVYRGKISEGLDLADDFCRAVIVIGMPYPAWTDPHVQLKREYLDAKRDSRLTKDDWYDFQMLRAVNQAIGRVVRHRNDYGIVILIDCAYNHNLSRLSQWLQEFVRTPDLFKTQKFAEFFQYNVNRTASAAAAPAIMPPASKQPLLQVLLPDVVTLSSDDDDNSDSYPPFAKKLKIDPLASVTNASTSSQGSVAFVNGQSNSDAANRAAGTSHAGNGDEIEILVTPSSSFVSPAGDESHISLQWESDMPVQSETAVISAGHGTGGTSLQIGSQS